MLKGQKALLSCSLIMVFAMIQGADAPKTSAKVILTVSHAWPSTRLAPQYEFDKWFMKRHPDIIVKSDNTDWMQYRERMLTRIASGAVPDIMYTLDSWTQIWAKAGVLTDLTPNIKAAKDFNPSDFSDENLKKYRQGKKLFAIPFDWTPLPFYFNKTLFDQVGVKYPALSDWTMERFRDTLIKLTKDKNGDGRPDQWGIQLMTWGINWTDSFFKPWGASMMAKDEKSMTIDSPKAIKAMEFWTGLALTDKVIGNNFEQAKTGIAWVWNACDVGYIARSLKGKAEFDVGHLPKGPETRAVMAASSGYGITSTSKHKKEAWLYVKEYLSPEGMQIMREPFGVSVSRRSARTNDYPGAPKNFSYDVIYDMLNDYAQATVSSSGIEYVYPIITREFEKMYSGKRGVTEGLSIIKREGDIQLRIRGIKN